ncbi:MAG TPA: glutathione S-transferase family protein [Candidatus Thermoplasmatota archaeon]|nr:glutathione S-transferase family protein [Candidatus Thermoplasmatota archaeon]
MAAPARSAPRSVARLFHLGPSHYCEKARKILQFKRIPFELVDVPYGNHQQVIRETGQDYVPAVVTTEGKPVLWPEIADWAQRERPEPTLYPGAGPAHVRARCRVIEHWAHNVVEELVWRYVVADVPERIADPQARWVFVELQERKRGPLEAMAARKGEFLAGVKEVCGLMQGVLADNAYFLGDKPSLADFALYGALHPLGFSGNEIPREFAPLRTWHERVDRL